MKPLPPGWEARLHGSQGWPPLRTVDLPGYFVSVSQMPGKRSSRLLKILAGAVADAEEVIQLEGRLERFAHFWALVIRQFIRYRCFVRASALSFSTLLALIPLLAVALSVTSRLLNPQQEAELTQFVENTVSSVAPPVNIPTNSLPANFQSSTLAATNSMLETNLVAGGMDTNSFALASASNSPPANESPVTVNTQKQVADGIHDLVQKASNGTLGATSLIFLVITAISLLRGIEETFNDMWGVTRCRDWWLQFMLYWSIITVGPLLLATALSLTGSGYLQQTRSFFEASPFLAPVLKHVLPIAIFSLMLGLVYKLTPNTEVHLGAAMTGGLFAGASWHIYNQLGFLLVSRALSASKLYGGLALVVLVMGGLYILWLIILFGAQIAYAYQNRAAYVQDRLAENVNHRGREFVALRIMTFLARRFQSGQCPATVPEISADLGVPSRLTQTVLRTLEATRLVTETCGCGTETAFVPARPLDAINAHDILIAMRTGTGQELPVYDAPELVEIYGEFARIEAAERNAAAGVTLLALANRMAPRAELAAPQTAQPQKVVAGTVVVEKTAELQPVELPKPAAFPEKVETPERVVEEKEPPRRETVRPEENTDFPL